jgi:hypothetical protein
VRREAIRLTAGVLNVHNIDMIWDEVEAEEKRLAEEEDAQNQLKLDQQQKMLEAPAVVPGTSPFGGSSGGKDTNGAAKNGKDAGSPVGGQKATTGPTAQGQSPAISRLQKGRPPNEGATGPRTKRQ